MCIEINRAKRAKEDIPVWKVMQKGNWRDPTDYKLGASSVTPFQGVNEDTFRTLARYFSKKIVITTFLGRVQYKGGYHCFGSKVYAEVYRNCIQDLTGLTTIQYYIPKGELYAEGIIQQGYIGQGLDSLRARTLGMYGETKELLTGANYGTARIPMDKTGYGL